MMFLPISLNIVHSGYNPSNFISSTHYPRAFLHLPTPHFYRLTTNHSHHYVPDDVQTISICHASPHQPHSEYPGDYTSLLHILNYTSHIHHIIPSDWNVMFQWDCRLLICRFIWALYIFFVDGLMKNILFGDGRLSTILMPLFRCINFKLPSMFCIVSYIFV